MTKSGKLSTQSQIHLVIGGGTIGARVANRLADEGQRVVVVSRSKPVHLRKSIEHRAADATSVQSLKAVESKVSVVYNCVNPPYTKWISEWPRISDSVSEYAMSAQADLVICSNLYGYGPHDGPLTEGLPLNATWANGRARAECWEHAADLYLSGKLRVTEVRPSDFIVASEQGRMGHRVVPNLMMGKPVLLLGALDEPHTWTDPDDVARLMVTLANNDQSWGKPWHVPSNEPRTQREVVADIAKFLDVANYRVRAAGRRMETLLGLFNPLIRELNRGGYQFDRPFVMDSTAARAAFGLAPKPWKQVIKDLVSPYLALVEREGKSSPAHVGEIDF